jgi:hypothetical protein
MGCCHNFGLGINWLRGFASADNDQGRVELFRKSDYPPLFRPGRCVHPALVSLRRPVLLDRGS